MTIELSILNDQELKILEKELAFEFKKRKSILIKKAKEELRAVERKHGLTIEQILYGKISTVSQDQKSEDVYKYRNPEAPYQLWTGLGEKPKWFIQAIQCGKSESSLLIQ